MLDVLADWSWLLPVKVTVTETEPKTWLTDAMEQEAAPPESVVAVQL